MSSKRKWNKREYWSSPDFCAAKMVEFRSSRNARMDCVRAGAEANASAAAEFLC